MANITFTLCGFKGEEGDTVFFKVKDPSILESNYNSGLDYPAYYVIKATITNTPFTACCSL